MQTETAQSAYDAQLAAAEQIELPQNIAQLVARAASDYGDRKAMHVLEDDDTLTFQGLKDAVWSLAAGLQSLGVGRGSHVAVFLSNRIEFPVAWLAIASLGAVMVPTNSRSLSRELDYLYNDGDVEFIITEDAFVHIVEGMNDRPACITDERIVVCGQTDTYSRYDVVAGRDASAFAPDATITREQLLNIQYTSGTTGLPKGCMQTQEFWLVCALSASVSVSDIGSLLSDHPFYYIDPQWMVIYSLATGATYHMAKRMSSSRFLDWICAHNIEFSYFPKPILELPVDPREKKTSMKQFTVGAISRNALSEGEARFDVPIYQNYGMTEIGAALSVPGMWPDEAILDTCGLPMLYRELRIVDLDGNDVPDGEPGELVVRGKGIFLGYYKKDAANQNSFFGEWFRTGDVFIKTPEGYYKIVGRIKDMIRRSNENISALEVEHVISEIPEIAEAAVVPVPDDKRGEEVKIYIRLADGASQAQISPDVIWEHARGRLAAFKVPRFIAYVDAFPHTASGKISKHQLTLGVEDLRANAFDAGEHAGT